MVAVQDVAKYILTKQGPMTAMKLQKLTYYSQAWHLVWEESPLFNSRIEAWANGPVCTDLYDAHRGKFQVASDDIHGDVSNVGPYERRTIDPVLAFYGKESAMYLSDLTHRERPWSDTRGNLPPGARSTSEISLSAMEEYYGGL